MLTFTSDYTRATPTAITEGTVTYGYDANGQVISTTYGSATHPLNPGGDNAIDLTYDENGNRTALDGTVYGPVDEYNRLSTDSAGLAYDYDDEGNLIARYTDNDSDGELDENTDSDIAKFEYDYRNRLTRVEQYSGQGVGSLSSAVDYVYDAFNRRIARHEDTDGDDNIDTSEYFAYDDTDVIL